MVRNQGRRHIFSPIELLATYIHTPAAVHYVLLRSRLCCGVEHVSSRTNRASEIRPTLYSSANAANTKMKKKNVM